jgi:hypothetical protein
VMMIMIMVIMIMIVVVLVVGVMSYVGGHDTRQADRVMGMVVAVSGLCRGRSREESDCTETGYRGSSKNESVTGHGCFLRAGLRLLMWHRVVHVVHVVHHHVIVSTVVRHCVLFANFAPTL